MDRVLGVRTLPAEGGGAPGSPKVDLPHEFLVFWSVEVIMGRERPLLGG